MTHGLLLVGLLLAGLSAASHAGPQRIDRELAAEIAHIRAIDNHSHADPASPARAEPQDPAGASPFLYPIRLRPDNHEYAQAWRALWGDAPAGADLPRAALRAKWRARREKGEGYPAWVLDQAGIESALVNADQLGPGQAAPRFRWVPQADELLFPLQNETALFRRIVADSGLGAPPARLGQYVTQVVTPTLERWKAAGAVAIKFAVAYRRPLDFGLVTRDDAERTYSAAAPVGAAGYKELQDHLFRTVCAEAGRLGLVVHIHTGVGADPYFNLAGARPALLEPALNDPALRQTRFVLVHGGWPFQSETGVMLIKPNVYADFSAQPFLRSTHALAETLRAWLEWYPEKILFGSDAYSEELMDVAAPLAGWEEKTWLTARTSREALAMALSGMIGDGQITRAEALELARLVLRGNAERLYALAPGAN